MLISQNKNVLTRSVMPQRTTKADESFHWLRNSKHTTLSVKYGGDNGMACVVANGTGGLVPWMWLLLELAGWNLKCTGLYCAMTERIVQNQQVCQAKDKVAEASKACF